MGRGRPPDLVRRRRSIRVIERLQRHSVWVTYRKFRQAWFIGRPPHHDLPPAPSESTFRRLWTSYRLSRGVQPLRDAHLVVWIVVQFARGTLDYSLPMVPLLQQASRLLVSEDHLCPAPYPLQRAIAAAKRILRQQGSRERLQRLEKSLGVVKFEEMPLAQRWSSAQEFLHYPLATTGKANLAKMEAEHRIYHEISETLVSNRLDARTLLRHPDCEARFGFIQRHYPSILSRWEKLTVLEALPFYLAWRLQESIDAILTCFLRLAQCRGLQVDEDGCPVLPR